MYKRENESSVSPALHSQDSGGAKAILVVVWLRKILQTSPLDIHKDFESNVSKDKKAVIILVSNEPYFLMTPGNTVQSSDKTFMQKSLFWFTIMGTWTALLTRRSDVHPKWHVYDITNTSLWLTVEIGKASVVKSRSLKAVMNLMSFSPLILFSTSSTQTTP